LATLITPYGEEFAVTPLDLDAGFTKNEIDKLIQGDCKAIRLKTGDVLLLDSLMCVAGDGERNHRANCLLRTAIHDPGGEVCGCALLLAQELARAHFTVIQARTADEVLRFCQDYSMHILVADVSTLQPTPVETLDSIRDSQPQAKVLLISIYDLWTVGFFYPGLLMGVEFLQKPFALNVMANTAHWMVGGKKTSQEHELLVVAATDSS
jgi:hypothetical protein